ncbi:unnamed protein product [Trifolium pratense]|uniref:Uncharacterized protein n=1 Tax=Trifolium pratense TaxID=57577 RepID=A0ACB0KJE0_TRIPR|nr:unnamed protein product [Trifolium pratense]
MEIRQLCTKEMAKTIQNLPIISFLILLLKFSRDISNKFEKWVERSIWLSRPCLSYTLAFLDECIKSKEMWNHLKPHLDSLITHVIFPIMCLSPDDVENFDTDPEEYLHHKLNYFEETSSPDVAATNFLVTLTKMRRKHTFTILTFVNKIVSEYETTEEEKKNHIAKEGALRMIGTLSGVILGKKSPIAEQVEYFLVRFVFPDFQSQHGYLRARACNTVEKFEQLEFKDSNNLLTIYHKILECMTDSALPVRVEAALALQPLIRHDVIRTSMQQNIPQIMQQLLKLANEVDVDALSNVMEDFVEVFATELTPFALALSEQLRDTYLRIIRELLEKNDKNDDDNEIYGEYLDDKSITALGVLQTIGTLILTLESTPDVLHHMESILMPVIKIDIGMRMLTNNEAKTKAYKLHLMEMIINAIYYNPIERKLYEKITPWKTSTVMMKMMSGMVMILLGMTKVEGDDDNDDKDDKTAYINYLNEEAQNFKNLETHESDDELGEESLLETILDRIEPYVLFRDALLSIILFTFIRSFLSLTCTELQQEQPPLYESLIKVLTTEEKTILQGVIHQADINASQAIAALQGAIPPARLS